MLQSNYLIVLRENEKSAFHRVFATPRAPSQTHSMGQTPLFLSTSLFPLLQRPESPNEVSAMVYLLISLFVMAEV